VLTFWDHTEFQHLEFHSKISVIFVFNKIFLLRFILYKNKISVLFIYLFLNMSIVHTAMCFCDKNSAVIFCWASTADANWYKLFIPTHDVGCIRVLPDSYFQVINKLVNEQEAIGACNVRNVLQFNAALVMSILSKFVLSYFTLTTAMSYL